MSASQISLSSLPCGKNFHSCWKFDSSDKNNFAQFFKTRCTCHQGFCKTKGN